MTTGRIGRTLGMGPRRGAPRERCVGPEQDDGSAHRHGDRRLRRRGARRERRDLESGAHRRRPQHDDRGEWTIPLSRNRPGHLLRFGRPRRLPAGARRGRDAGDRRHPGHRGPAQRRHRHRDPDRDCGRRDRRHGELRDQHQPRQRLPPEPADRPLPARRPEPGARHQQRRRLRFRRLRPRLSARRCRHLRPGGRHGLVVRQLQHRRRGPARRPRRAAEYGSFTGVVFNSVTKSGGNEFKGLVDAYYSNESLSDSFSRRRVRRV